MAHAHPIRRTVIVAKPAQGEARGGSVSMALLRGLALALGGAALLSLAAAVVAWPSVLARWVLADGDAGEGGWVLVYAPSVLGVAAATVLGAFAARVWRRAPGVPARKVARAFVAALASLVLALVLAEVAARVLVEPDRLLSGDAEWIARWLDGRVPGEPSGELGSGLHAHDPDLGWIPAAGYRDELVSVNASGLRGARELPAERPAGERRVVVVGDSFTFGEGVADAEVFTERLSAQLGRARVSNLGVMGYGIDQQYLRLVRDGLALEPDLVIVGFYEDDAARATLAFRDYAKPRFDVIGGELRLTSVPVPAPEQAAFEARAPSSHAWALVAKRLERALARTRFAPRWKVSRAILDGTLAATQEHDTRLLLAYFPARHEAFRDGPADVEAVLARWAGERGVAFLSLREAFRALPGEQRARVYHGHWTPFGHEVVAGALAAKVQGDGLLEPESD